MSAQLRVRKTARRELTVYERGRIVGLREAKVSWSNIEKITGIPKSTARSTVETQVAHIELQGTSQPRTKVILLTSLL